MRIACPSCTAAYEVPASRMKPNRMVRCERCGNEWAAVREADSAPDPDAGTEDTHAPHDEPSLVVTDTDRLVSHGPAPPRSVALIAAWIATIVVLAGALTATIIYRAEIVRAWPPSARLLGGPPLPSQVGSQIPSGNAKTAPPAEAKPVGADPRKTTPPPG